jgi:hypothetical protein
MRNILAALLVGFIIVMTQSGSVIVIGVFPDQDATPKSPGAVLQTPEPLAQHALVRSESDTAFVRSEPLLFGRVGPRRGPVK